MKKLLISLIAILLLTGCSSVISEEVVINETREEELVFKSKDLDFSYDDYTGIIFDDNDVNITSGGTYLLSGTLDGNSIIVDCKNEEVKLVLDNVTINSKENACINIVDAKKVTITLASGSTNTLTDDDSRDDDKIDACIYSKADLVINGEGTLNVSGNYKHGIVSKDDLIITGGTLNVEANNQGITGKDSLKICVATINVKADSDGLKSDNDEDEGRGYIYIKSGDINVEAGSQGIAAFRDIYIDGGNITISDSYEGLEASYITINDGNINISASDDGMNASNKSNSDSIKGNTSADISINGGEVYINAKGDGLDSNGTITINGGNTFIEGPTDNGNCAFDYETGGYSYGGNLLAIGSSGMAENFSENSNTPCLLLNFQTTYKKNTTIVIYDGSGNKLFDVVSSKKFNSLLLTSESFNVGDTITIEIDGEKIEQTLDSIINGDSGFGEGFNNSFGGGGVPGNFNPGEMPENFNQNNMPEGNRPERPNGEMSNNNENKTS